ncbi:MAG: hypothetical protein RJA98_3279 [Pseudomonadota bacterium]
MLTAALAGLAIVTADAAPLRSAPRDSATPQAQLAPGDLLEVRGQQLDHLQVYDHRRERAGFVRASQVRLTRADAAEAPELLAVLRFVRDTPGQEAVGMAYAAAYLKAAPAAQITAEPFDAMGQMAERLARRASARSGGNDSKLSASLSNQLDGVAAYGVRWQSIAQTGSVRLCYDGEAYRRVLAMGSATAEQRAHAALGLTRHDCVDPALGPRQRDALDHWRAEVLDRVSAADLAALPQLWKNRVLLRRAGVAAALAHSAARSATLKNTADAQAWGQRAVAALAAIQPAELTDEDQAEHADAAIRVSASRWAAEAAAPPRASTASSPTLLTQAGADGETCVLLVDAQHDAQHPLLRRCTWGVAWLASADVHAAGTAVALAVQPLATWRELWLMTKTDTGWILQVLPPAAGDPLGGDIGSIEFAGWTAEGPARVLLAREARVDGRVQRRFEVMHLGTGAIDKQASNPQLLASFQRWADPVWKRVSVSLR